MALKEQVFLLAKHSSSIPFPRRLRTRAPLRTPIVPAPRSEPLLRRQLELAIQLRAGLLPMYEVAEPAAHASLATVEPTARLAEVRHGAELAVDGASRVPAAVERVARRLRAVLVLEARVHVADQVVVVVVAHHDFLDLAELAHLAPDVLVERVEVVLQLRGVQLVFGVEGGVLVEVGQQDGLAVAGLDVLARAAVAVAAGTDLVVEGAVDLVLLRAKDGGEVVGLYKKGFCQCQICRCSEAHPRLTILKR